ncbi:MAG: helix-turn-helix transcriptional regulator [Eubacteriales bacterium]|nr:helix-turn-helix transcriptional regulator [Eubacteriales bacterium]
MSFINFLSERVKLLRTAQKESQQALADSIKITKSSVSRIESANQSVTVDTLLALAEHYNVSIDYLIGRTEIKEINQNAAESEKDETKLLKEEELLHNFRNLDDMSKGRLIERSRILLDESKCIDKKYTI